jgi:hypothetical protein
MSAGAFWTPVSSISFDGVIIMEPYDANRHVIGLALEYPSPQAFRGEDPRANPKILEALAVRGKLE